MLITKAKYEENLRQVGYEFVKPWRINSGINELKSFTKLRFIFLDYDKISFIQFYAFFKGEYMASDLLLLILKY